MSALVSIIIPIYNLEKYIKHCLESVVNQTYKELEIICIDDGSTDGSAEIIKSMAESDPRIKYIYQENAGVSAARNKGLDTATGEYVMFVDGDDYLHYQTVEILIGSAAKTQSDFIFCNFVKVNNWEAKRSRINIIEIDTYTDTLANLFNEKEELGSIVCSAWGKLFLRRNIQNIRFKVGCLIGEDTLFTFSCLTSNMQQKITYIDLPLYFYYNRSDSACNSKFTKQHLSWILAEEEILNLLYESNNDDLIFYGLNALYTSINILLTAKIGSCYEKWFRDKTYEIGVKHIKRLIFLRKISPLIKIRIIILFFLKTKFSKIYQIFRIILDRSMREEYKKRKI